MCVCVWIFFIHEGNRDPHKSENGGKNKGGRAGWRIGVNIFVQKWPNAHIIRMEFSIVENVPSSDGNMFSLFSLNLRANLTIPYPFT